MASHDGPHEGQNKPNPAAVNKRASMREGPLASLFRKTEPDEGA